MGIYNPSGGGSSSFVAPTIQRFLSTGTGTGSLFTVTSANATIGATYTDVNSIVLTVLNTISAGTLLFMSGFDPLGTPSGTLTKASGTGDATITFTAVEKLGTYTTPVSPTPLYLEIEMSGGGGGGGGNGTSGGSSGGPGGITTFGTSLLIANGGAAGLLGTTVGGGMGGAGGTATINSGPTGISITGGSGDDLSDVSGASGTGGGDNALGGGAGQGNPTAKVGSSNTGGGGGGAVGSSTLNGGGGGGAGGYIKTLITSPSGTYFYTVGVAGTAGTAGTAGKVGAAGGSGIVIVKEFYQ